MRIVMNPEISQGWATLGAAMMLLLGGGFIVWKVLGRLDRMIEAGADALAKHGADMKESADKLGVHSHTAVHTLGDHLNSIRATVQLSMFEPFVARIAELGQIIRDCKYVAGDRADKALAQMGLLNGVLSSAHVTFDKLTHQVETGRLDACSAVSHFNANVATLAGVAGRVEASFAARATELNKTLAQIQMSYERGSNALKTAADNIYSMACSVTLLPGRWQDSNTLVGGLSQRLAEMTIAHGKLVAEAGAMRGEVINARTNFDTRCVSMLNIANVCAAEMNKLPGHMATAVKLMAENVAYYKTFTEAQIAKGVQDSALNAARHKMFAAQYAKVMLSALHDRKESMTTAVATSNETGTALKKLYDMRDQAHKDYLAFVERMAVQNVVTLLGDEKEEKPEATFASDERLYCPGNMYTTLAKLPAVTIECATRDGKLVQPVTRYSVSNSLKARNLDVPPLSIVLQTPNGAITEANTLHEARVKLSEVEYVNIQVLVVELKGA
jgi:hypothetical protein